MRAYSPVHVLIMCYVSRKRGCATPSVHVVVHVHVHVSCGMCMCMCTFFRARPCAGLCRPVPCATRGWQSLAEVPPQASAAEASGLASAETWCRCALTAPVNERQTCEAKKCGKHSRGNLERTSSVGSGASTPSGT